MLSHLRTWLRPPVFPDAEQTDRAALLHFLSILVFAVGVASLLLQIEGSYFEPGPAGFVATGMVIFIPVVSQVLLRRGSLFAATVLFLAFVWASSTTRFLFTDGIRSSLLYNYANMVIFAGLMLGRRAIWVMFVLGLLPMIGHIMLVSRGVTFPPYFHDSRESALVEYFVSAAISAFLFWYALGSIEKNLRAVRESESRHRALLSALPDIIFLNHREGTFLDVKYRSPAMLLLPPEVFIGKKPHDVLPAPLADGFIAAFHDAHEQQREQILEYSLPMAGADHYYEARVVPCTDDTVMTVARNISRRKHVEARLQASERQFRDLFQNAPIGIGVLVGEDLLAASNEAFFQLTGFSKDDTSPPTRIDSLYVDPANHKVVLDLFRRHGGLRGHNIRLRRKDGKTFDALLSLSATEFDGQPAIQTIIEDVTAYRRGESLREAVFRIAEAASQTVDLQALYRSVHEIIGGVMPAKNFYIALYDADDDLLSFPYFVDERDEPSEPHRPGRGLTEFVLRSGRSLLCDEATTRALMEQGDADVVGVDAPIWLGVPLLVGQKPVGVMAVQDYDDPKAYGEREQRMLEYVSSQVAKAIEQKRTDQKIRQLNTDLERRVAERTAELTAVNQELESFVYTISHDLRAPLRGVGGFAALLQREHSDQLSPEARGYVQRIADGTRRMGALIDDLLAFAHISRKDVRRELVQTGEIVRQVVEELQPAIGAAKTEVTVGHLPPVSADQALLRQVFSNLIANAVKYSSKTPAPRVTVTATRENGGTTFTVSDNGVGFDMKYAHKLFGVFQRLHAVDEFEGTGVGLAIVHRIVTRHGGQIWVHAAEGLGATFSFTLEDHTPPPNV